MIRRPSPAYAAAALLAALAAPPPAAAQPSVDYLLTLPEHVQHEARIVATFRQAPRGRPLEVRMSRSSPGRYALHEFAKNVYDVEATDGAGRPLRVTRPDPYGWTVEGHDGTVRFAYTLFGDRTDGTYSGIDASHAHLNGPATWAWARGMERAPATLTVRRPDPSWRVATQLVPVIADSVYRAPDLQYLMDSPVEVGPVGMRSWAVTAADGGTDTVRLAVHHLGTEAELDAYAEMAKRVVAEQVALYGTLPTDHGTYTFLADYLPWASGDGMEHRNSTILTSTGNLGEHALRLLGTVSHEFFHLWNVERIRPASLEPFDFERANMSGELWFAEGFTSYYDDLFIRRAGLYDDAAYARALGWTVGAVVNSRGRRHFSPVEMSMQAPFVDAATSVDPNNRSNTFLSYYTWGAGLGLALDLELRTRFPGRSLDDLMREMWRRHGATARPYTVADVRDTLAAVSGDAAWAADWFARYVEGREAPPYAELLARAGFLVRPASPDAPWIGAGLDAAEGGVEVTTTLEDAPARAAGLARGDVIRSLDGRAVTTPDELRAVVSEHAPGDRLAVEWEQRGTTRRGTLVLGADPSLEVVPFEAADRAVTDEMRTLREAWLGSKVAR